MDDKFLFAHLLKAFLDYLVLYQKLSEEEAQLCLQSPDSSLIQTILNQTKLTKDELQHYLSKFQCIPLTEQQSPQESLARLPSEVKDILKEVCSSGFANKETNDSEPVSTSKVGQDTLSFEDLFQQEMLLFQEHKGVQERYITLETLGEGGMGIVERVQDCILGREVALKRIKVAKEGDLSKKQRLMLWRLNREASIMALLEHPNIIPLHDMQRAPNGEIYFTMRKVEGKTLSEILKEKRFGSPEYDENKLLSIFIKVCDAVSYAHSRGIIHRDLKPENIMVGQFGEVYVMDWGIAKKTKEPLEERLQNLQNNCATVGVMGTPGYMAPEQQTEAGEILPETDIYALGKILRQCFTYLSPFEEIQQQMKEKDLGIGVGTSHEFPKEKGVSPQGVSLQGVSPQGVSPQGVSPQGVLPQGVSLQGLEERIPLDIQTIIKKAVEEDWKARYKSVKELLSDVERFQKNLHFSLKEYWDFLLRMKRVGEEPFNLIPMLLHALKGNNVWIRQEASWTLGQLTTKSINPVPSLIKALQNPTAEIRMEAAWILGKLGSKEALPDLARALKDEHEYVRRMSAWAIYRIPESKEQTIPYLIQALSDSNEYVRMVAAVALGGIGKRASDAVPALLEVLQDPDTDVRVRVNAAIALGDIGASDKNTLPVLIKTLEDTKIDHRIRGNIAISLGKLVFDSNQTIPALMKSLLDPYWNIRAYSAWALGNLGELAQKAIPKLIERLQDPEPSVGAAAALALGEIKAKEALPPLLSAQISEKKELSQSATIAIEKITLLEQI